MSFFVQPPPARNLLLLHLSHLNLDLHLRRHPVHPRLDIVQGTIAKPEAQPAGRIAAGAYLFPGTTVYPVIYSILHF